MPEGEKPVMASLSRPEEGETGEGGVRIRKAGKRYVIMANGGRMGVDSLEELVDDVERIRQAALQLQSTEKEISDSAFAYLDAEGARKQPKRVPFWINGQTFEAVELEDGALAFLTYDGSSYSLMEKLDRGNERDVVPESLAKNPYRFIRGEVTNATPPELAVLFPRVLAVVEDYFAHLDLRAHKLLAMMLVHSYALTKSIGTAFLWLVGPPRSGKTTFGTIVERLGYRVFSGVKPTESTIYRTLGSEIEYAPTVVIKEYAWATETQRELAREGDIPGSTKPVTEQLPNGKYIVVSYYLYGWRVVGSNNLHGVDADLDRYFVLKCMHLAPRRPRSELHRDRVVMANLEALRKDLLLWKVANLDSLEFPFVDPEGEIQDRDWEHFGGVLTLAKMVSSDLETELRTFVGEYIEEKREEESGGAYSTLLNAVQDLATSENKLEKKYRIAFKDIWALVEKRTTEGSDKNGKPVRATPSGETLTTTKAGRLLREQLAGKPDRWGSPAIRGYTWPEEVLKMLAAPMPGLQGLTGLQAKGKIEQTNLPEHETSASYVSDSSSQASQPVKPVQPVVAAPISDKSTEPVKPVQNADASASAASSPGPNPELWYYCVKGDSGPWGAGDRAKKFAFSHREIQGKDHVIELRPRP
jgi:hypothetical protein